MSYFEIRKKYLAQALSFLGFKYYMFTSKEGYTLYSFAETDKFKSALDELLLLKDKYKTN